MSLRPLNYSLPLCWARSHFLYLRQFKLALVHSRKCWRAAAVVARALSGNGQILLHDYRWCTISYSAGDTENPKFYQFYPYHWNCFLAIYIFAVYPMVEGHLFQIFLHHISEVYDKWNRYLELPFSSVREHQYEEKWALLTSSLSVATLSTKEEFELVHAV